MNDLNAKISLLKQQLQTLEAAKATIKQLDDSHAQLKAVNSTHQFSKQVKLQIFMELFKGRTDVFSKRWSNLKTAKSGYFPVCSNEWIKDLCNKPQIKCKDCLHQSFMPLTTEIIIKHLTLDYTVGIYPLLPNNTCWFLAVDFDQQAWQEEANAFMQTCYKKNIPASLERSRSGNGAHIWIFFAEPVLAADARRLGAALLSITMEYDPKLRFESYDRFFPNQDIMPKGGFGNLIALPLQYLPRQAGNSVFIDHNFNPYSDQWAYLSSVKKINQSEVTKIITEHMVQGKSKILKVTNLQPWATKAVNIIAKQTLPKMIKIILSNQLFIENHELPVTLLKDLTQLATFSNPEFYKAQNLRLSTFNKPRLIVCAERFPQHLALPRGCLTAVITLLNALKIEVIILDQRNSGNIINAKFLGKLTVEQQLAANALIKHDTGVLVATTAFGKTVVAANIIAARQTNTLILVHRRQLLEQWVARLTNFLAIDTKIGIIGGGKYKLSSVIDVAIMQSLYKNNKVNNIIHNYGQLIIDECHHLSAVSFEKVVRASNAKYVFGLTATLTRKDGHHPIVLMQCGQVRYNVDPKSQLKCSNFSHKVIIRTTDFKLDLAPEQPLMIQQIYTNIMLDPVRNQMIINDVLNTLKLGRSPLLITERKEHVTYFAQLFTNLRKNVVVMVGGQTAEQRKIVQQQLATIPDTEERLLIATGSYIGEGFDDARLDTMFLAMPISWQGKLAQYVGRLHRLHHSKQEIQIYDYVDVNVIALNNMAAKRKKGYKNLGYTTLM